MVFQPSEQIAHDEGSLRGEWQFDYSAADLCAAAKAKAAFHAESLARWEGESKKRERRLKRDGIDVRTAVRPGMSSANAYFGQPNIDGTMMQEFQEAQERVAYHTRMQGEFVRWARVLDRESAERQFSLAVSDVEYFSL